MTKRTTRNSTHLKPRDELCILDAMYEPLTDKKYDWTIPDGDWPKRVSKKLSPSANALEKILSAGAKGGLKREYLLFLLFQYCKSADKSSILARRDVAGFAVRKAGRLLLSCNKLINGLAEAHADRHTRHLAAFANSRRIDLVRSLHHYAAYLRSQITENERVATKKSSGLDDSWLLLIAAEVKLTTGKPHVGEIATLVEGGLMALDLKHDWPLGLSRRGLVSRLKRFGERFPGEANRISTLVFGS